MSVLLEEWRALRDQAWRVRKSARVLGSTKVGAAVLTNAGEIHCGCNVEHRFRSHDVHSEVNALSSMVASGEGRAVAIVIAAERDEFTPCGACLDWIFELGGASCLVAFSPAPEKLADVRRADELMPHYPC